jgi:hypothetical protein
LVLKLRQFDRQTRFVGPSSRGEDVQNQLGAIEHFDTDGFFKVPDLRGVQVIIEDHQVGVMTFDHQAKFFDFAFAKVSGVIGRRPTLNKFVNDLGARGGCQTMKFLQRIGFGSIARKDQPGQHASFGRIVLDLDWLSCDGAGAS